MVLEPYWYDQDALKSLGLLECVHQLQGHDPPSLHAFGSLETAMWVGLRLRNSCRRDYSETEDFVFQYTSIIFEIVMKLNC